MIRIDIFEGSSPKVCFLILLIMQLKITTKAFGGLTSCLHFGQKDPKKIILVIRLRLEAQKISIKMGPLFPVFNKQAILSLTRQNLKRIRKK